MYTVKKVKRFRGHDGYGFNADLYCDGKKVAFVFDDANGGEVSFQWVNGSGSVKDFKKYVEGLPKYDCPFDGSKMSHNFDTAISFIVTAYELAKDAKRLMKRATFYVPSKNVIRSFTKGWNEDKVEMMKRKFPDAVILSTLKEEEVVEILRKST